MDAMPEHKPNPDLNLSNERLLQYFKKNSIYLFIFKPIPYGPLILLCLLDMCVFCQAFIHS